MAAGTPVVASALPGYRNVATDGVDAVLITHEHVDHLDVDKLADALGKRRLRQRLIRPNTVLPTISIRRACGSSSRWTRARRSRPSSPTCGTAR